MFIDNFSVKERQAFIALLNKVVNADGVLAKEEGLMMEDVIEEAAVEPDLRLDALSTKDLCALVKDNGIRAQMLMELTSMAYVDSDYAPEEKERVRDIGVRWGVDLLTMVNIEEWGRRRIELAQSGVEIVHECLTRTDQFG